MKQHFAAKHFAADHFASGHWTGIGVTVAVTVYRTVKRWLFGPGSTDQHLHVPGAYLEEIYRPGFRQQVAGQHRHDPEP